MTSSTQRTRTDITALLNPSGAVGQWTRRIRWLIWLLVIAIAATGALVMLRSRTGSRAPAYTTETVTRGDLQVKVSATGSLQPTNTVDVGSELSGLVDTVLVDVNDPVKRNQVLLRLDTSKLLDQITRSEAELAAAEAKLAQSSATVKESTANLDRLREVSRLSGGRVPSGAEMETAVATLARAEADRGSSQAAVREARAALSSDRTNLSKASIRSPIDGVVLKRSVEPGQTVAASLQVATLFTIAEDLRKMELQVDVDEADVGHVKDGQRATFTVDAYPDRKFSAVVTRVAYGSTKNGDVVSYTATLNVNNDDLSLRPGMTASAEIESASTKGALLVPNAALRFTPPAPAAAPRSRGFVGSLLPGPRRPDTRAADAAPAERTRRVWVLRDGAPVAVPVTVGQTDGRFTEITGGNLQEGAAVITDLAGSSS